MDNFSFKIISWIDRYVLSAPVIVLLILSGTVFQVWQVDVRLQLSDRMHSATDEIIYLPIFVIGFAFSFLLVYLMIKLYLFFVKTFFPVCYKHLYEL